MQEAEVDDSCDFPLKVPEVLDKNLQYFKISLINNRMNYQRNYILAFLNNYAPNVMEKGNAYVPEIICKQKNQRHKYVYYSSLY